ncbi:hypothetical protein ANN_12710 [Periplaneta americana]|uniref:Uncharacterized protein n=1 Tax=Periplaneta americana TaxID=6978 RepID=A0ABQ8THX2_PERAM|nr:hypothetical protein ANN_12710 [Periplaneta americana]
MAGLCEGGNEPPGSLKAICNWLFMRPKIRHRLPDIRLTVEKTSENPNQLTSQAGIEPMPERNSGSASNRFSRLSYAVNKHDCTERLSHRHGSQLRRLPAGPKLRSGTGLIPAWTDSLVGFFPEVFPNRKKSAEQERNQRLKAVCTSLSIP